MYILHIWTGGLLKMTIKYITGNNQLDAIPNILHIGCGSDIMGSVVNIDSTIPQWVKDELVCLPINCVIFEGEITGPQDLPKKHFKRVEAHMVLEHIHPDLIPNLLYCLCNFLQDNGVLVATVPNFAHLAKQIVYLNDSGQTTSITQINSFRELTNEFLCPNMCGMEGHQSIWIEKFANLWLKAEGFELVEWKESDNKMHVTFKAVKRGGDHASSLC